MGVISNTVGDLRWTPPPWARKLGIRTIGTWMVMLIVLAIGTVAAYRYYQSLPSPPRVVSTATPPAVSPIVDNKPQPQPVYVDFVVKTDPREPIEGTSAIARVDLIGNTVVEGISLSPAMPGTWDWVSDTQLRFQPERDWPAEQDYTVSYSPDIFAPGLEFDGRTVAFTTPAFTTELRELKFYQNPVTPSERRVVATLSFSHVVEPSELRGAISLGMRDDGQTVNDTPTALAFEITTDEAGRTAHVQSQPIQIPERETFATLSVKDSLTPVQSSSSIAEEIVQTVRIPDISSYFKIDSSQFLLARDENDEPQQTVTLSFSDRVDTEALGKKITVYRLPANVVINGKTIRKNYWESPREVTPDILSQSEPVSITLNPQDSASASLHSLRMDAPVNSYYYLRVDKGLESDGNFVLSTPYDTLFYTPTYPQEVHVAQDGAILPLTGSHKVHFVSRGVSALKVEISRLLDGGINHLASQIDGDIKDARFSSYRFNQDNLTERDVRYITLPSAHPKTASFAHLDLSSYLEKGGYYVLRVSGWDPQNKYEIGGNDQRLLLITDLGFVAKVGADGQQDLFVHSLSTGEPVAGASVDLLGKNGLPVLQAVTAGDGHARMPSATEYTREKTATVYVVRSGSDAVFMPYGRYTRQLDYSRFDTSGEYSDVDGNQLRAQLFTERDLFRPGDEVHLAAIVKRGNWRALDRLPLRWIVRDPRGQVVMEEQLRLPADGFVDQTFQTSPSSHTGNYEVALYTIEQRNRTRYLGGHQFKVEEFQPDRLRIRSRISGQQPLGWIKPANLHVDVQLDNLFGTPASNRRVQGSALLRPAQIRFSDFSDFVFTDPLRNANASSQTIERPLTPATTSDDGSATLPLSLDQFDNGIYELTVYTEGFEAGGGRSVKSQARVMLSPLDNLIGYKASGDLDFIRKEASRSVTFMALDSSANPVDLDNLTLQHLESRFVSTLVRQADGTFAYQSISKDTPLAESPFSTSADGTVYELPTEAAGRFVVQIVDDKGSVLSRVPYVVAGARNLAGNLEQNAELDIALDKNSYAPGDLIELHISAPYSGTGLITIERDAVLVYQWFRTPTTSSVQTIRVPDNLEGNAYINVAFMRGLDSPEIYLNPLSYALKSFSIKRDARTVNVSLDVPAKVVPGDTLDIQYRTDRPARIVVFAVDQGILQVANYQRPKPLDFFLRKRALRVSTYQLADLVLPEFVTASHSAAPGGGEAAGLAGKNLNPFRRKTEAPVVFWSGVLDAGPDTQQVSYLVPDYFNGELAVMAVAVAEDAVGDAATRSLVQGPFVISPNAPVSVAPGDEFEVSVGIANNLEGSGLQAPVQIAIAPSSHLSVVGEANRTLMIDEGRESSSVFRIRANDKSGSASFLLTATSGNTQATLNTTMSVRPATPYTTTVQASTHDTDPARLTFERVLREELAARQVNASTNPTVLADGLQSYLDGFPHACAEQIVSKVFPQLGLYGQNSEFDDARFRTQFSDLIGKLRSRQLSNGGFRFWQSSNEAAEFPSVYIAHFLTEASTSDLPVPRAMQESAMNFLRELAARAAGNENEARLRAYAIYVLTRNGVVTTNYLTSLQEYLQTLDDDWKRDITAMYMAASYRLVKLNDLADTLVDGYSLQGGNEMYSDFDTRLGRDAQYIYLLARHFPQRLTQLTADQLRTFVSPVIQNRFNTLSSAYTILALQAYAIANAENGNATLSLTLPDGTQLAAAAVIRHLLDTRSGQEVVVAGGGSQTVFASLTQTGFDHAVPDTPKAEGIEVDRRYLDANGNPATTAVLGDELTVRLRVRSTGQPRTNVAIVDLLPGGFEVLTDSLQRHHGGWSSDYSDVREDRVVTYGTFTDRLTEIRYSVKVTAAGTFTIPSAYANSMYDPTIQAHSAAGRFTVTRPTR